VSLGCEVAQLAGVEQRIVERAKQLRAELEARIEAECKVCIERIIQ